MTVSAVAERSKNHGLRYVRKLKIFQHKIEPGDFFKYTSWKEEGQHYETKIYKVLNVYPHHVLFETDKGHRESFTFSEIYNDFKYIRPSEKELIMNA